MFKKSIFIILALCIPCLFISGCFKTENSPKIESTIVTVLNDSYTYDEQSNTLSLAYDSLSSLNFTKADFSICDIYNDGSSKTVNNESYSLSLSCALSQMKPDETYRLNFVDNNSNKIVAYINLKTGYAYVDTIVYQDNLTMLYTGEDLNIIDKLDTLQTNENNKISKLINDGVLTIESNSTSSAKIYNAHGYKLNLGLANGYRWKDGSDDSITINWNIERIKIIIPEIVTELTYNYEIVNGSIVGIEQIVVPDFGEFENHVQYSGIRAGTDAFEYRKSFWISLKSRYSYSHVLYHEGTQTEYPTGYEVLWRINPYKLPVVSLKNSDFTFSKPAVDIIGNNKSNLENFDSTYVAIDYANSVTNTTTAGDGKVRIKILDSIKNNFTFSPSNNDNIEVSTDYLDINFTIKKGTFTPTSQIDYSKLKLQTSYHNAFSPSELRLVKTSPETVVAWTEESWNYLIEQGLVKDVITDGFHFKWAQEFNQTFNAGSYENLKLNYYHHNENYHPIELEVDLTINKALMNFTTTNVVQNELPNNKTTYSAEVVEMTFSENFKSRLEVLNSFGMAVNYILEYRQTDSSTPITHKVAQNEYEPNMFSQHIIDAGKYSLMAEISCDGNYALSVDGGEQTNLAYVKYDFEIEKFSTNIIINKVENNLTKTNSFYETNDSNFYYKQGQSVSLTLTGWKEDNKNTSYILYWLNTQNQTNITTLVNSFTYKTYYRQTENDEWCEAENTTNIGYYKNVYSFTPVSENIVINSCEYTWKIHSNVINFTTNNLEWEKYGGHKYNAKEFRGAIITNLPDNMFKVKYYNYVYDGTIAEEPTTAINKNTYVSRMRLLLPSDGSVTLTFPMGMFDNGTIKGDTIEYCYANYTFWSISKYYLNPIEFSYALTQDYFVFDDKVFHKVEYEIKGPGETVFDTQLKAFLNRAVFTREYEAKPEGDYVAVLQLPVSNENDNFDYAYEAFVDAGYRYDEATDTLYYDLPWKIVRE